MKFGRCTGDVLSFDHFGVMTADMIVVTEVDMAVTRRAAASDHIARDASGKGPSFIERQEITQIGRIADKIEILSRHAVFRRRHPREKSMSRKLTEVAGIV